MTEESMVRELMDRYTEDEPPLRLTIEDVRREAAGSWAVRSTTAGGSRRRWLAPLLAAAVCAALVGGLVSTQPGGGREVTPAGGGMETPTPTTPPSDVPTPTASLTQVAPVAAADMPDLLRSIATQSLGAGTKERTLTARTWTFNPAAPDVRDDLPLSEADSATEWAGSWENADGSRRFSIVTELLPPDLSADQLAQAGGTCPESPEMRCTTRDHGDGWRILEVWTDATGVDNPDARRVRHDVALSGHGRVVVIAETRYTRESPDHPSSSFLLTSEQLEQIATDVRLQFAEPAQLPPTPSRRRCMSVDGIGDPACAPTKR